jgi:hypothetical protein
MTDEEVRSAQHLSPVWRDRANFIIRAALPENGRFEQLWCRQVDDTTFEVCCIPFFLYDIALGDVVRTSPAYLLEDVVEASGRGTYRLFFPDESREEGEGIVERLTALGALVEWSSRRLLAVATPDKSANAVVSLLEEGSEQGGFLFERAWL